MPKGLLENLEYRKSILRAAVTDKALQADLMALCSEDILYWTNVFCWTFDPRKIRESTTLPMITYEYQDEDILETELAIEEGHDILKEKSRDMGATWDCLINFDHRFLFKQLEAFLLVSRKEEYVYKPDDHKALFSKVDFINTRLPLWMMPGFNRRLHCTNLHMFNPSTGSTIDGESTTGDVARGDRRTAILLDEFAAVPVSDGYRVLRATRDATRCRVFNSTPNGVGNAFHDMRDKCKTVKMHWSLHPEKAAGLYLDTAGKLRSPWYDNECKRAVNSVEIAQELDIDYLGSNYQFYPPAIIDKHKHDYAVPAYLTGNLDYIINEAKPERFVESEDGLMRLWIKLGHDGKPPKDRSFVFSADIAVGTGASNSCLSGADRRTREKVFAYADPNIGPEEFAKLAVAVCRWFAGEEEDGAFLIWEANGPGRQFGKKVLDLSYRNIYFRRNEKSISKTMTDVPGYWTDNSNKRVLLGEYRQALKDGDFVNRDALALNECLEYVHSGDTVVHSRALSNIDPTGARENHGDRVIADALCFRALREFQKSDDKKEAEVPVGSFLARRLRRQSDEKKERYW